MEQFRSLFVVSAVHFAPYLTGLSSMMLIKAAIARSVVFQRCKYVQLFRPHLPCYPKSNDSIKRLFIQIKIVCNSSYLTSEAHYALKQDTKGWDMFRVPLILLKITQHNHDLWTCLFTPTRINL